MDRWEQGFSTQAEVFDWVATSQYFDSAKLARSDMLNGTRKRARDTRTMFQNFLDWTLEHSMSTMKMEDGKGRLIHHRRDVIEHALRTFGKRELFLRLVHVGEIKQKIKQVFSGKLVTEWTGVQGTPVRWIMDEVQNRSEQSLSAERSLPSLDGVNGTLEAIDPSLLNVPAWQVAMGVMSPEEIKELTIQVKEELGEKGKLSYDIKAAKKRKAERKAMLELPSPVP